jgi:hypothetical protein
MSRRHRKLLLIRHAGEFPRDDDPDLPVPIVRPREPIRAPYHGSPWVFIDDETGDGIVWAGEDFPKR